MTPTTTTLPKTPKDSTLYYTIPPPPPQRTRHCAGHERACFSSSPRLRAPPRAYSVTGQTHSESVHMQTLVCSTCPGLSPRTCQEVPSLRQCLRHSARRSVSVWPPLLSVQCDTRGFSRHFPDEMNTPWFETCDVTLSRNCKKSQLLFCSCFFFFLLKCKEPGK